MTNAYASVAIGTAASLMTLTLLLLRVGLHRRNVLALTSRWIGAGRSTSLLVLTALFVIAAGSFASLQLGGASGGDSSGHIPDAQDATSNGNQALQSLAAYAGNIDDQKGPPHAGAEERDAKDLPAVDVMVAKLIARLKGQPNDVAGWKMLGWSYLNTNRPADAVEAYQTALKLEPGNIEAEKALNAAKSQLAGEPPATNVANAERGVSELDDNQSAMIRDMVDRLATRLETSPDDEQGWTQLMRSRMVQGERDSAKAAFAKALEAFKTNSAASERLTAVARDLGVETPAAK